MPSARLLADQSKSSLAIADVLPIVVMAPSALALIWVQASQLMQISFSVTAHIAVFLFLITFIFILAAIARTSIYQLLKQEKSWILLVILCAIFSLLSFILVKWDADDNDYLANAVHFLNHPKTKMGFEVYYIHQDGEPITAIAWLNSYAGEYFLASFNHVLGIGFLSLYWSGKSIVAAFLIPCAWYSLFHKFNLRHDAILLAIITSMLAIFIMGDTFEAYGNWFITRLFHGKVILLALCLPLIWNYTLAYIEKPNVITWVGLFSSASVSIALTTTAGIIIPFTMVALVSAYCIAYRVKFWLELGHYLALVSAFTYLIAVTLFIRFNMNSVITQDDGGMIQHYPTNYLGQLSFVTNFSFPISAIIIIVTTLTSIYLLTGQRQRLLAWWCGLFFILFISPLTSGFLIENITSSNLYLRLFHVYPIPLILGISSAFLYNYILSLKRTGQFAAITLVGIFLTWPHLLLVAQISFGWERTGPSIIRAIHRVSFGGPRVSAKRYSSIQAILQKLPKGPVLAAHPVSLNLPIFSGHHPQIFSRQHQVDYIFKIRKDSQRAHRRTQAIRFANGESATYANAFFQVLQEEPNLKSLVLHPRALTYKETLERIKSFKFRTIGEAGGFRLFIRD